MDELRDIKPLVQIPDFSLYVLVFVVFVAILVLVLVAMRVYSHFKNAKKSKIVVAKKALKELDFTHSKKTAYIITKYASYLIKNSFHQELYDELLGVMSKYKYQKEVPLISDEDREKIKTFLEACDV